MVKLNIFAVLLLASAISLSSCVNEAKNPVMNFPTDTSSVPIDTMFLHGFKKVSIFFFGASRYYYAAYTYAPDTVMNLEYSSSNSFIPARIDWTGKRFQLSGGIDTAFSHGPDSNGLGFVSNESHGITMKCNISRGGKLIDSGQFTYSSFDYTISTHDYLYQSAKTILQYRFLPQTSVSADSIVYSFSGNELQENIPMIRDSSIELVSTYPLPRSGIPYSKGLQEILWTKSPSPILRIIFYK